MKLLVTGGSGFIGTNLVEYYLQRGDEVLSVDLKAPQLKKHASVWRQLDIRDYASLNNAVVDFKPDFVIHMAARANLTGATLSDYSSNTTGVENLLVVCNAVGSVRKIIFASTMLVCRVGYQPKNETDYCPTTLYGESKVVGEQMVRNAVVGYDWVIVRPTSVWGPWFGPTYRGFFDLLMKRRYFNFTGKMSVKTYGYIGNVVYQLDSILSSSASSRKTMYLGDYTPTPIKEWADEIASEIKYRVVTVPREMIWIAAKIGDLLKYGKVAFPMNSFRFKNMTTDNVLDLSETRKLAPETKYSRVEGNRLTIEWILEHSRARVA